MNNLHIVKESQASLTKKFQEDGLFPQSRCPMCGRILYNKSWIVYEFRQNDNNIWKHDCSLKDRLREVGIRGITTRRYHNIVNYVRCASCETIWRGNIVDDRQKLLNYSQDDNRKGNVVRSISIWISIWMTITLLLSVLGIKLVMDGYIVL